MTESTLSSLSGLLSDRRSWLRRHSAVALICGGALVMLASLLLLGVRTGYGSEHPGAIIFDAALMGVLASLFVGSVANAWSAWRFGSRISSAASASVPVACQVRRLAPETRMRKDYLMLSSGSRTVLVRCAEDAPTTAMAEVIDGEVLGWPARRGGIVLMLPHFEPIAATVGRYHRHLPRALRSDFSAGRLAGRA